MSYVFGIDLGTTYSCIAYMDQYGKPVVLKNSDGDHTTPSVVMFEDADNVVVGVEAKRSLEIEPDKTVQFIKRKMGQEKDKVTLNGREYSAPEVSAYILKKLVADANAELIQNGVITENEKVKDVVITCPAYFGMNEREATRTAGQLAGLNVLEIINEPTAAAISYGVSGQEKNETVLVYDLGGGTFDITVMRVEGKDIRVICTGGDDQLGGKDWDEAFMNYVLERYEEECEEDLSEDPENVAALYVSVEEWKKSLTSRNSIKISVNASGGRFREELSREKHEEITEHLLTRTKNLLDDVLRESEKQGYPMSKINKVLLVGGSSRMPQVAAMLERDYGVKAVLQDPDEAVAKGAAIFAMNRKSFNDFVAQEAKKTGKTEEEIMTENMVTGEMDRKFTLATGSQSSAISITNVLSRTYGIAALVEGRERICNFLKINDPLPASNTQTFVTEVDNQSGATLSLYESKSTEDVIEIEGRKPLTTIEMTFTRAVPKDTPIEVTMMLDNSGIIHIVAEESKYHSKLDTTYALNNQMTEAEKQSASRRLSNASVE